jgi:hypothetical protein
METHASIVKVCKHRYMSDTDIYFALHEMGFEGNPSTASRERRVVCQKGLLREKDFANKHNNGTHKRFIAVKKGSK